MNLSTIDIRVLTADEWEVFRRVRLRTLTDSPQFFGSTLAEAQARTERDWRAALADRTQFLASADGVELGTVAGMIDPERGGVHLISMWVAPEARGTGVADLLVRAVLDWAAAGGHTTVWLEFAEGNVVAERLYLRNGFVRTGVTGFVRPGDPRVEYEMVHKL
ncbi:acetyltransferase (GNAT) family protein [Nocardia tenerifensis]|uniref:Acetyltransferase (GNAT) family protein n=1 Tax=Nocardia tenerifensis TaxID=228006 RepID=A0A318K4F8_9NOCA|nr:GNAT family N-acetyltransferase [Nocardia tenerifensis]PXX57690.1 acetyltransferase (GNAT) family protein [Nocardia tenerifensis]